LTIKHIVSSVPDEDVVSCTAQDDVSPTCATKPIPAVTTEDTVISALGVHNIVPCGPEDEIIGGCAVAGSYIDEIDPGTLRRFEIVRRD
jgi:hypothetical protein